MKKIKCKILFENNKILEGYSLGKIGVTGGEVCFNTGTSDLLNDNGVFSDSIFKVGEGRPNIVDAVKNNEIDIIINTPFGGAAREDEYEIGRSAIRYKVPVFTTMSGAQAAVRAIRTIKLDKFEYRSLKEIFN